MTLVMSTMTLAKLTMTLVKLTTTPLSQPWHRLHELQIELSIVEFIEYTTLYTIHFMFFYTICEQLNIETSFFFFFCKPWQK